MKNISPILILYTLLASCSTSPENEYYSDHKKYSKLEFYENMTKIKLPEESRLISVIDTNFISIGIIRFHKLYSLKFYTDNKFMPINDTFSQTLLGIQYLDTSLQQLPDNSKLLRRRGKGNGTLWMCLLDTTTCTLYFNFSYPDTQGNTKAIWYDPFQEDLSAEKEKFSKQ